MKFNPSRLVLARKRRGLSKIALAKAAKIGLRSVVYYESGDVTPTDETAQSLAVALQFPVNFFYEDDIEEISSDVASFRSLSKMTASQRDSAIAMGTLATAVCKWIERQFELPTPDVPSLRNFEPEAAALVLRNEWGLGERPIKNVVHLLEAHGVRVFSLPIDSVAIDAFSVWHQGMPFVFLNPMKSGERGRTDAAHELGHLTLHEHGVSRNRQAEAEADLFAASFLMPVGDVIAHTPRALSVKTIHKLKKRWRVSAIALVHRLKALNLITEWQYRRFCLELSQTGYRSKEHDGLPRDTSQIFAKVFAMLREEGRSRGVIARDLQITLAELESLLVGLVIASVSKIQPETQGVSPSAKVKPDLKIVR
jgi:Zn-dependent peptidase ImmA (M78 family)/transcriptional regulator with XRE-family HTH domain